MTDQHPRPGHQRNPSGGVPIQGGLVNQQNEPGVDHRHDGKPSADAVDINNPSTWRVPSLNSPEARRHFEMLRNMR